MSGIFFRVGYAPQRRDWLAEHLGLEVRGRDVTVSSEPGKGSVFTVRLPGGAIA
jgi:hypothetical protein